LRVLRARPRPASAASIDPFDQYQHGALLAHGQRLTHGARGERLRDHLHDRRPSTPSNPAVVTGSGEHFVFRHLGK